MSPRRKDGGRILSGVTRLLLRWASCLSLRNTSAFLESLQSTSVVNVTMYHWDDNVIFPVGRNILSISMVVSCQLSPWSGGRFPLAVPNLVINSVQEFFRQPHFFLLGEDFCSLHPQCSSRHIQEKRLVTGILLICFSGLWLNRCVPSCIPNSPRKLKSGAHTVYHCLTLMLFCFVSSRWL